MAGSGRGRSSRVPVRSRVRYWPRTRPGWWAAGLAAASIVLVPTWRLMGAAGAVPGLSCGLAGGTIALWAIVRHKERAVIVLASMVPFAFAVIFLLAEVTIGHS